MITCTVPTPGHHRFVFTKTTHYEHAGFVHGISNTAKQQQQGLQSQREILLKIHTYSVNERTEIRKFDLSPHAVIVNVSRSSENWFLCYAHVVTLWDCSTAVLFWPALVSG